MDENKEATRLCDMVSPSPTGKYLAVSRFRKQVRANVLCFSMCAVPEVPVPGRALGDSRCPWQWDRTCSPSAPRLGPPALPRGPYSSARGVLFLSRGDEKENSTLEEIIPVNAFKTSIDFKFIEQIVTKLIWELHV